MDKDFGNRIKKLQVKNHESQADLAMALGVVKTTISAYVNNKCFPSLDNLIQISQRYDVTTDYLLGIKKNKNR